MYFSGSDIHIFCSFKDITGDVSCVLVYREYGNTTITVREFKNEETWSNISLSDPDKYTFAVFGKNGSDIDQRPILSSRGLTSATTSPTDTTTPTRSSDNSGVIAGVVSLSVAIILFVILALVVVFFVWERRKVCNSVG